MHLLQQKIHAKKRILMTTFMAAEFAEHHSMRRDHNDIASETSQGSKKAYKLICQISHADPGEWARVSLDSRPT